jgi:GxxExxY protein
MLMSGVSEERVRELCGIVRETGFSLHKYLKSGHIEKVYENGLATRLIKAGLKVHQQYPVPVYDEDGTSLGDYAADLLIEDCIIAEVKAAKAVADEHVAQLIGYLRGTRKEHGLLINFGAPKFWIKKYILTQPRDD